MVSPNLAEAQESQLNLIPLGIAHFKTLKETFQAVIDLAFIGNVPAENAWAQVWLRCRDVFDKETRRKALAFAADAVYGRRMLLCWFGLVN